MAGVLVGARDQHCYPEIPSQHLVRIAGYRNGFHRRGAGLRVFKDQILDAALRGRGRYWSRRLKLGRGPRPVHRVGTDPRASSAPRVPSAAARRDHLGGRVPVNLSGGLAWLLVRRFPAQAIAQVCELTWHWVAVRPPAGRW